MRLTAWWLLGCGCTPADHEGDDAGECSDGADNDRNGYFDCEDHACTFSPDCETGPGDGPTPPTSDTETDPTPTDTDTDTDPPKTTPIAALADYATYTVVMTVDWTFPTGAFDNCSLTYEGSGVQLEATTNRVTFTGPYTRTETTCTNHALLESAFPWYDPATDEALVSFKFTGGLAELDEWYADPSETTQGVRAEWWMFDMAEPYDPVLLFVSHSEGYADPGGLFFVAYEVEVEFSL